MIDHENYFLMLFDLLPELEALDTVKFRTEVSICVKLGGICRELENSIINSPWLLTEVIFAVRS